MSIENIREEFEKHRTSVAAHLIQGVDWAQAYERADQLVSLASFSAGWRAAIKSLAIELPPMGLNSSNESQSASWHSARNNTILACRRAIEAAGVKIEP